MNPWKKLHNEFKALMEEEDRIVQQREARDYCHLHFTHRSGMFDGWVEGSTTDSLQARFELLAAEAGVALGAPAGTAAHKYWLQSVFLGLRAKGSSQVRMFSDTVGVVERLFEASTIYSARLARLSIESAADVAQTEAESLVLENSIGGRSAKRREVLLPILASKRWTRGKWATKAGVGKNCVYDYLSGKRNPGVENRRAMADVLGLRPEDLPA
jgi:hypothetical protein